MMPSHNAHAYFEDFFCYEKINLSNEDQCRKLAERKGSNSQWMIGGGARHFAKSLLHDSRTFESFILGEIHQRRMDIGAIEGESDKVGSAVLLLMTKRGLIQENEILRGGLFHDCAREFKFDKHSDEIKFVMKNWNNIVQTSED